MLKAGERQAGTPGTSDSRRQYRIFPAVILAMLLLLPVHFAEAGENPLPPETLATGDGPDAARGVITHFSLPVYQNYRVDSCLYLDRQCGEPAANAWCRAKGFAKAIDWAVDHDIGATAPTYLMGDQGLCDHALCDGFLYITCAPK
ncbi:hypothetical protein [Desulfocastanea catecholica]